MAKSVATSDAAARARQEVVALAKRAQQGDKSALPALREVLRDPGWVDRLGGDLAARAQRTLIEKFSGDNLLLKEVVARKLELLRAGLTGPGPTPLERLLVERVAACWLHLHHLEMLYAGPEKASFEMANYFQKSLTAAQKRYLAAIKALATVRKLALPVLQVNIAKEQINVAGPAPGQALPRPVSETE